MTSRAFIVGSFASNTSQHSNHAPEGLRQRDIRQAIDDLGGSVTVVVARLGAALLGSCALLSSMTLAAPPVPSPPPALKMGDMVLPRCGEVARWGAVYCGRVDRPLDPTGQIPGLLSIYFELYPHTAPGSARGMLVATEGGPGYPATQSRDEYLALFDPLRRTRDVLIMDNRGTGKSGALNCPQLQTAERWTTAMVGACGDSLGDRAALYGTALAVDDLAAILSQLGTEKIDLYGDSYGTYFEQVFAIRHPGMMRSVVLDGAYALNGPDYAWYPSYAPAMRDKFDLACKRSAGCSAIGGSSMEHIGPLLAELRRQPLAAQATDGDGKRRTFMADPARLATVMFGSGPALATIRELDAAARAFLAGDHAPLFRLMAETIASVDSEDARNSAKDITQWSAGLEVAVMCHDPPQIFDMRLPPAQRAVDLDRVLAERRLTHPDTYAPFTIDEYRGMPLDYSFIDQCVAWPVAPAAHPAGATSAPYAHYPDVPALVISGELDNMTTPADGAAAAAAFPRGRQILIANSFHVNALPHARSECAAGIVRHFIETLDAGDTSCASQIPAVRLVERFALHAAEVEPAVAVAGNAGLPGALRLASAAVQTVGDVMVRVPANSSGHGAGLRGGAFKIAQRADSRHIALDGVRWTEDLAVSGTIDESRNSPAMVRANVTIEGPDRTVGKIRVQWAERLENGTARITGTVAGRHVDAEVPAP